MGSITSSPDSTILSPLDLSAFLRRRERELSSVQSYGYAEVRSHRSYPSRGARAICGKRGLRGFSRFQVPVGFSSVQPKDRIPTIRSLSISSVSGHHSMATHNLSSISSADVTQRRISITRARSFLEIAGLTLIRAVRNHYSCRIVYVVGSWRADFAVSPTSVFAQSSPCGSALPSADPGTGSHQFEANFFLSWWGKKQHSNIQLGTIQLRIEVDSYGSLSDGAASTITESDKNESMAPVSHEERVRVTGRSRKLHSSYSFGAPVVV